MAINNFFFWMKYHDKNENIFRSSEYIYIKHLHYIFSIYIIHILSIFLIFNYLLIIVDTFELECMINNDIF
jgi:hypothetical protein